MSIRRTGRRRLRIAAFALKEIEEHVLERWGDRLNMVKRNRCGPERLADPPFPFHLVPHHHVKERAENRCFLRPGLRAENFERPDNVAASDFQYRRADMGRFQLARTSAG